jgi:hypothetical protein
MYFTVTPVAILVLLPSQDISMQSIISGNSGEIFLLKCLRCSDVVNPDLNGVYFDLC